MASHPPGQLSDKALSEVIGTLEQAEQHHRNWLHDLHASMICGRPFDDAVFPADAHCRCRFGRWYYHNEHQVLRDDPEYQALDTQHKAMHDCARKLAGVIADGQIIAEADYRGFVDCQQRFSQTLLTLRDQLKECLHSFDALTGVMTRSPFMKHLTMEQARSTRNGEASTVALIDIDHFKQVNDTHGHLVGDRVLQSFAQYLLRSLRAYDSVCRYGGEEFVVCLPQTTLASSVTVMERMRRELADLTIQPDGGPALRITVSVGLAELRPELPPDGTLELADGALYRAKAHGRNRVMVHVNTADER